MTSLLVRSHAHSQRTEPLVHRLTADFNTAVHCTAPTEASEAKVLPFADDTEQADSAQSWPGLFWVPPADDGPAERDMLHLDDELAGLLEAADMPAAQDKMHSTKPESASSAPGEQLTCI